MLHHWGIWNFSSLQQFSFHTWKTRCFYFCGCSILCTLFLVVECVCTRKPGLWLTLNPLWDLWLSVMCPNRPGYSHYNIFCSRHPQPEQSNNRLLMLWPTSGDRLLLFCLMLLKCCAVFIWTLLALNCMPFGGLRETHTHKHTHVDRNTNSCVRSWFGGGGGG